MRKFIHCKCVAMIISGTAPEPEQVFDNIKHQIPPKGSRTVKMFKILEKVPTKIYFSNIGKHITNILTQKTPGNIVSENTGRSAAQISIVHQRYTAPTSSTQKRLQNEYIYIYRKNSRPFFPWKISSGYHFNNNCLTLFLHLIKDQYQVKVKVKKKKIWAELKSVFYLIFCNRVFFCSGYWCCLTIFIKDNLGITYACISTFSLSWIILGGTKF